MTERLFFSSEHFAVTAGPTASMKGKKEPSTQSTAVQHDGNRTVAGRFTVTKTSLPAGSPATASMSAASTGAHTSSSGQQQHQQAPPPQGATPFMPFQIKHFPIQQHHPHISQQQPHSLPPTTVRLPHHPNEMEYVQVDTSYQPAAHAQQQLAGRLMPITMSGFPDQASAKKGVLSQLIDKVRSKDERKKSSASGVSSSSSGGTNPQQTQPSQVPPATTVMGRRALSMYDAQCQYGTLTPMQGANSAVEALALANSSGGAGTCPKHRPQGEIVTTSTCGTNHHSSQRRESRPIYSRAKSFVKSKSDDERPPSKLSKESRARSAGQLETESLLRSLSTSSKDASRILSLYQGLIEHQQHQFNQHQQQHQQMQQRQQQQAATAVALQIQAQQQAQLLHQHQQKQHHHQQSQMISHGLHYPPPQKHHSGMGSGNGDSDKRGAATGSSSDSMPPIPKLPAAAQQHILAQQQAAQQHHHRPPPPVPQHHQPIRNHNSSSRPPPQTPDSSKFRGRNGHQQNDDDDDYQFLPMNKVIPVSRSQSAPPRKPPPPIPGTCSAGNGGTQQVRVYVHEEPRSTRSSPSATLSKSLQDTYLYGFLTQEHAGGLTPSSSGGQSGYGSRSAGRGGGVGSEGQSAFTPLTKKPTSAESLVSLTTEQNSTGHSRKSSIDFDRRSVVTVRRATSKSALITRQHSWEAGTSAQFAAVASKREQSISTPQLSPDDPFGSGSGSSSRHSGGHSAIVRSGSSSGIMTRSSGMFYDDDDDQDLAVGNALHKADSFEGHEEAVRSIVAAVQETRSFQRKLQSS